jgi:hypothetical protein
VAPLEKNVSMFTIFLRNPHLLSVFCSLSMPVDDDAFYCIIVPDPISALFLKFNCAFV